MFLLQSLRISKYSSDYLLTFCASVLYPVPLLLKSQVPIDFNKQEANASSTENSAGREGNEAAELSLNCMVSEHESEPSMEQCHFQSVSQHFGRSVDVTGKSLIAVRAMKGKLGTGSTMIGKKKERGKHSQRTIRSFFQRCESISSLRVGDSGSDVLHPHVHVSDKRGQLSALPKGLDSSCTAPEEADNGRGCGSKELDEVSVAISDSPEHEKNNYALLEWQRIQHRMQTSLPLCRGHNEPCVARFVKKSGPNIGRGFYVCARAKVRRFISLNNKSFLSTLLITSLEI